MHNASRYGKCQMHHGARYDVWMTDKAERLRQAREKVDDGIETTCKEYVVDERGDEWLVPRSTNPLHHLVDSPENAQRLRQKTANSKK